MDLVDKFTPAGWYENQRKAIRNVIQEKNNWYQLILKVYDLDPGTRRAFLQNFLLNASLKGSATQESCMEKEECNIPWADPSGSHLGLQPALHRMLGRRVRESAEFKPEHHRFHYPAG